MPASFSLSLPRDPAASFLARQAVRDRLADVLPASTLADVTLAVSELVTNAVLHGSGDIELRVEADEHTVKGEVIDEGGGFERQIREDGGVDGVAGRGLMIVGQLAERWGVHEGTTHVWFEIPVTGVGNPIEAAELDVEEPELGHPGEDQLPDA
ncbi:MAG TPA: ATP-binding protein [Solirubrobacteraceae bacterium]|jgi:anti-sigma regulatory factor (Ser/Thr protein kinase)|nr:ATP-binding protein [Solirubrobacteraceae bacterium]